MKTVVAGALGECVHVAGVNNFLRLAETAGWRTLFLGPATPIERFLEVAREEEADLVGVSYRLTPETGERLLGEFAEAADDLHSAGVKFIFGGTPPVARKARKLEFFEQVFDGTDSPDCVLSYLRGGATGDYTKDDFPQSTIERIKWKAPYPLIRHHFGLPTLIETIEGIHKISESSYTDVISLGTDQDAQEHFFHPERQNPRRRGAGGVPVRSPADFIELKRASRRGNYPLIRTYTGTDDFIPLAEVFVKTIDNAWAAIPIYWFNRMDGRGPWDLRGSIEEHQKLMAWYGERDIPVEINEPHHWGMRDSPDVVFTVAAYLSAYNARACGVKDYIAQLMFNSPPGLSDSMDLAKMLAILELINPLAGTDFRIWRQTRTGLLSFPVDFDAARAHLSASTYLQMALRPHIVHVVGYTEADHAATATEVVESCKLARRSIENGLVQPDMSYDPVVQERKEQLIAESIEMIKNITSLAPDDVEDPLADPATLENAVTSGILDAPQLINNPFARGEIRTMIDKRGACVTIKE
jgi:hypothetical protein